MYSTAPADWAIKIRGFPLLKYIKWEGALKSSYNDLIYAVDDFFDKWIQ